MIKLESGDNKQNALEIKRLLSTLPQKIKEIKDYEIGLNIKDSNTNNFQDLVLFSSFENLFTLNIYSNHPDHQKVVQFIKQAGGIITAVDYEY
jgi:hypothetical protein